MRKLAHQLALVITLMCSHQALAQSPESMRSARTDQEVAIRIAGSQQTFAYKKSYALLIGVSAYKHGWAALPRVEKELAELSSMLEAQGFHVTPVKNPTRDEMRAALDEFVTEYGMTQKNRDNRLFVFFSGHGQTREGDKGYLVPSDAPQLDGTEEGEIAFVKKVIAMDDVITYAKAIEAKHVLFVFDSCFAGTLFLRKASQGPNPMIEEATARATRQFLTAGGAAETVPAKSVFVPAFIKAIADSKGDLNKDQYVTGSELGWFLRQEVSNLNAGTHPEFGEIDDPALNRGDFVFEAKSKARDLPGAVEMWDAIKQSNNEYDYLAMLATYPEGPLSNRARQRLEQLAKEKGNSTVREPDYLQSMDNGSGTFTLTVDAPTGETPTFAGINDTILQRLCGDQDGCNLMLGITGWRYGTRTVNVPLMGPPCRFFIRKLVSELHWSVAVQCSSSYATWERENDDMKWHAEKPGMYTPYWSGEYGIDGVDKLSGESVSPDDRMHVLILDRACYLSETLPRMDAGPLALWPDSSPGFYLFASTSGWGGDRGYPDKESWPPRASGRACHLIIED